MLPPPSSRGGEAAVAIQKQRQRLNSGLLRYARNGGDEAIKRIAYDALLAIKS
jgi:hypothetical protein